MTVAACFCSSLLPGIPEESKVEAPAFTDAVRMYRQSKEQYGTWDMLCGNEAQVSWRRAADSQSYPHPALDPKVKKGGPLKNLPKD